MLMWSSCCLVLAQCSLACCHHCCAAAQIRITVLCLQLAGTDSSGIHGEEAKAAAAAAEGGAEHATAAGAASPPSPGPTAPASVGIAVSGGSPGGPASRPALHIATTIPHAAADHDPEAGKAARFALPIPEGAIDEKRPGPSDTSAGRVDYQAIYFASPHWAARQAELNAAATPAPGSAPIRMTSVYARSFFSQVYFLAQRGARGYYRCVPRHGSVCLLATASATRRHHS